MSTAIAKRVLLSIFCLITSFCGVSQTTTNNSTLYEVFIATASQKHDNFRNETLLNFLEDLNKTLDLHMMLEYEPGQSLSIKAPGRKWLHLGGLLLIRSTLDTVCSYIRPIVQKKLKKLNYQPNLDEYLGDYLLSTIDNESWLVRKENLKELMLFDFGIQAQRSSDFGYRVKYVSKGSRAAASDIRAGDKIVTVGGIPAKILGGGEFMRKMTIMVGDSQTIVLKRKNKSITKSIVGAPVERKVPRDSILFQDGNMVTFIKNNLLYIRLVDIPFGIGNQVREVLGSTSKTPDVLIDLRGCEGGMLNDAIGFVDLFVNKGDWIANLNRVNQPIGLFPITYNGKGDKVKVGKIIVLVNDQTAAGAELISAAIKHNKVGQVIGQKTLGYGTVMSSVQIKSTSMLTGRIRAGELVTHDLTNFSGNGIVPDIVIEKDVNPIRYAISMLK